MGACGPWFAVYTTISLGGVQYSAGWAKNCEFDGGKGTNSVILLLFFFSSCGMGNGITTE